MSTPPVRLAVSQASVALGGKPVLRQVSLALEADQSVAFVGPSGAGKTTLLRLLAGALFPDQGQVTLDGQSFAELADRPQALRRLRARVGFVHQDYALVPNLRAIQNVVAGAFHRQGFLASLRSLLAPRRAEQQVVLELLDRLGIAQQMFQRVDTLSGGQQQRVALARALYQQPAVLLADEPVSSVDPARARALLELMHALAAERGLPLVVSLHDATLARAYFSRIVGLRDGRLLFDLPAHEVDDARLTALYALPDQEA